MGQKGKKADSDFQSVFPNIILASTNDLLKWFFSFRKMLKGILVELWMSFVDISWCLCGHFAYFWLGICLRSSFPIFCPWKSIKIQQKILGMKYRHHKLWEMNKWHSENLKKISISFQHLTYCYEDKSFAVERIKEDTNFAGPIHMSIMKETRWLPKKCPLQKNNEISATEMITTELYTS